MGCYAKTLGEATCSSMSPYGTPLEQQTPPTSWAITSTCSPNTSHVLQGLKVQLSSPLTDAFIVMVGNELTRGVTTTDVVLNQRCLAIPRLTI
jgi:hypothetical protein